MTRRALVLLAVIAVLLIGVHAVLASRDFVDDDDLIVNWMWVEVPIYVAAVVLVLRSQSGKQSGEPVANSGGAWRSQWAGNAGRLRGAVVLILVVAAILRAMVLFIDPVSTDINRYIWDGRVQGAGINPYRYIPADPALQDLRDDDIYPDINRKEYAPTIYPPFAQIVFFLVTRYDEDITVMKTAMVLFDAVTILALMRLLKARRIPPTRIILYAWHPVPIWQFAGDGHVDAVAIACMCLALLAAETRRPLLAGIAIAGATLTKFYPVVIGPALYRRWDWKLPVSFLVTLVVLYLPYISVGRKVLGFSSGYSAEEGLSNGTGLYPWLLLKNLWPSLPQSAVALYWPALAAVLGLIAIWSVLRRRRPGADIGTAFLLAATFTALTSPHYIWYLAWLVPFLCFYPSWSVIWLTGAATFMNNVHWPDNFVGGSIVFLPFFALVLLEVVLSVLRGRRQRQANPVALQAG